ncbi:hypothetical protein ACFVT2_08255 [Streptomyces sp. NPDC058000]|uniref:hypothetical protein n=1 Tax=Streptomyces sp. NPDC058000 TaxID=3346299 RepID=UPI0036E5979D
MSDSSRSALRLALSLADPATADALAERMRRPLLALLADRLGLPEKMVGELLGGDAGQLRAALEADPVEWLAAAAETGDPVVGRALWSAEYRVDDGSTVRAMVEAPGLLPILLDAADFWDSRWYADDGLLRMVYDVEGPLMSLVLTHGFAGLSVEGLGAFSAYLPPPAVVDACLSLLGLWGTIEPLVDYLQLHDQIPTVSASHPWLPDLVRAAVAAPDPEAFLQGHRPSGEWADPEHRYALATVRCGYDEFTAKPEGLDWELILREHARMPFCRANLPTTDHRAESPLVLLTQWEGCPADLVRESFREDPIGTAKYAAELPFEVFTGPWTDRNERNAVFLYGLEPAIRTGRLSVERVLAEVGPAEAVLTYLPLDHEPTRKALAHLLDALGTNPANWLTFYARMSTARGSVTALIADATAPHARRKRHTSWPRPAPAQFPAESPEHARPTFLKVFACVSEEVQCAIVPYFDARAVQQLLVFGDPSPAVRDAVVAAHGRSAQVAMAGGYALSDEKLQYLLDLDEPAVDATLFRHGRLDQAEYARMLAGRLRAGGSRPVPEELLAALDDPDADYTRARLTAGLGSGDLGVARSILGRLRSLHLPASRLRVLVAVWERSGPDAVREILAMDHLPVTLRRHTAKLLDTPDGLALLRTRLAEAESPATLLAYLTAATSQPRDRLQRLRSEGLAPPWPALTAAQGAGSLNEELLSALLQEPDCPRPLLLAALDALPVWGADWIRNALSGGRLNPTDLLTRAAPARAALHSLQQYADHQPGDWCDDAADEPADEPDDALSGAARQPVCVQAAALTQEHLGANVDAWAVCLQLLPTFAGTLPELLATAGALTQHAT